MNLFFAGDISEKIVTYTNVHIKSKQHSGENRIARRTDIDELKTLFGLLFISLMIQSNHQNIRDLFILLIFTSKHLLKR